MTGFDILNITGSVRKSKQKDLFSAVTERSIMSPTLANSILGIRPGEGTGNSKCREWWKVTLSPIPPLGMALQFRGSSSALPSQAPAASTSCICPFGAPSSSFNGKNNFLLYMILELISLLLIRTSSSLSLALICLYSLYSSAIGVRSSFCTFLVGEKAGLRICVTGCLPSAASLHPPTRPTLPIREQNQYLNPLRGKNRGANKLLQRSAGRLPIEAEHNPLVSNTKPHLKHALLIWNCQCGKIKYSPWKGRWYLTRSENF